jgi:hypothetical protein
LIFRQMAAKTGERTISPNAENMMSKNLINV